MHAIVEDDVQRAVIALKVLRDHPEWRYDLSTLEEYLKRRGVPYWSILKDPDPASVKISKARLDLINLKRRMPDVKTLFIPNSEGNIDEFKRGLFRNRG